MSTDKKKVALITGITGQDGCYLSRLLLGKGYEVHGIIRRSSSFNTGRIDDIFGQLKLHHGDLTDSVSLQTIIIAVQPDEVYNLGAMSHVHVSFQLPQYTAQVDGVGTLNILEAIRACGLSDKTRFYQASTSELYGEVKEIPQKETTPFNPRSPYACAKLYAFYIVNNYRDAYNMFACNGILFNHESPQRGGTFVTKKITAAVARISLGIQETLSLGNLDAKRDWGHAADYVEAMWLMLQQEKPDDFVISTGEQKSVRTFVEIAFDHVGQKITWEGKGVDEVGKVDGVVRVTVDPRYFRPTEVETLLGDCTKAKEKLGWKPAHSFADLVKEMMEHDLAEAKGEQAVKQAKAAAAAGK